MRPTIEWFDSHCHVHDERIPTVRRRGDAAHARRAHDGHRRVRSGDVARGDRGGGAVRRRVRHGRAASARGVERRRLDRRSPRHTGHRRRRRGRARLLLRPLAPRRCSRRRSPRRSSSPTSAQLPLVIHTRDAWDDTFDILARRRHSRTHDLPLLHRRPRRGAALPRPRCHVVVLRHRHVQGRAGGPGRRRGCARSTGCWSRPTARTSHRCPTAANRTGRPGCLTSASSSPISAASTLPSVADATSSERGGAVRPVTAAGVRP